MAIIVRDQKTSQSIGTYKCPLVPLVHDLFEHWLHGIRPKRLALSHKNVFFSMSTSTPMSQQTFSKFAAKAFVAITGCEVNLQTIRRIVSEGTCISFASPRCIPAAQHI